MSCGVGHTYGLDPALLWLWRRPAAIAPVLPLAWELPYATGVALKKQKKKKKIILESLKYIGACIFSSRDSDLINVGVAGTLMF